MVVIAQGCLRSFAHAAGHGQFWAASTSGRLSRFFFFLKHHEKYPVVPMSIPDGVPFAEFTLLQPGGGKRQQPQRHLPTLGCPWRGILRNTTLLPALVASLLESEVLACPQKLLLPFRDSFLAHMSCVAHGHLRASRETLKNFDSCIHASCTCSLPCAHMWSFLSARMRSRLTCAL